MAFLPLHITPIEQHMPADFVATLWDICTIIDWDDVAQKRIELRKYSDLMQTIIWRELNLVG